MREIKFFFTLSDSAEDRIRINAVKDRGKILKFVVQYESLIKNKWHPIVRYDNSHGFAHKDIIHPSGLREKQPLYFQTFSAAFTFAIQDLKISWRWYRAAYEKELNNEEGNGS
ncbi:MAG: hypothetical protein HY755_12370 [Nitrospirae bacterium]|nr:hypothetical protein [Nitrospirota bacterium]